MKKIISLFLSIVMLLSITAGVDFSAYAGTSITVSAAEGNITISNLSSNYASEIKAFLSDSRWKHGTSWGQISPKLSTYSSKGCCAYVADFAKYVYNYNSPNGKSSHNKISNIKSGDIIKFPNHYIAVLKRNGNQLITAEGAYSNKVRVSKSTYTINGSSIYQNGIYYASSVTVAHYDNVDNSTANELSVYYNANGAYSLMDSDYEINNGLVYKKYSDTAFVQKWTYNSAKKDGLYDYTTFGLSEPGNRFVGWGTTSTGGKIFDQDDSSLLPTDINPNIKNKNCSTTLYAIWEPYTLSVLYNANGGTTNSNTYYANYSNGNNGAIFTKSDNQLLQQYWEYDSPKPNGLYDAATFGLTKTGYTFKGWSTSANGGKVFSDKYNELIPSMINPDLRNGNCIKILYAVWEEDKTGEVWQPIDPLEHICSYDNGTVTRTATCKTVGEKTYTCKICGKNKTETILVKAHTYKTITTKATTSKNGSIETKCTVCGDVKSKSTIYYPETITLSATSYTYDGNVKKPSVTVKGSDGKVISSSNYTVNYSTANPKDVGKYTVTINFKGNYSGTKTFTFEIVNKNVSKWIKSGNRWWYRHADGSYTRNGWEKISGKWYHFDKSGWMQTGWLKDGGKWYYLNSSGAMATGWVKVSGKWYYMNSSGVMQTGWVKLGGKWYYMNSSGVMLTGRQKIGKKWYTFNSSGVWVK